MPPGPDNPWANAFAPVATLLDTEQAARRVVDPARQPVLEDRQPRGRRTASAIPVAYKLVPGSTPTLLADPGLERRPSGPASPPSNLWVTPYAPDERRAAGDYPNQHAGGDGLPRGRRRTAPSSTSDIVVWYTFGVTHVPRPEDWPVMPVEYAGFMLVPVGSSTATPPSTCPPPPAACHD